MRAPSRDRLPSAILLALLASCTPNVAGAAAPEPVTLHVDARESTCTSCT